VEPEPEEEPVAGLHFPVVAEPQPVPIAFGVDLVDSPRAEKKRKRASIWPTAKETNTQLSLFD